VTSADCIAPEVEEDNVIQAHGSGKLAGWPVKLEREGIADVLVREKLLALSSRQSIWIRLRC